MTDLVIWMLSLAAFAAIVALTALAAKSVAGDPPRGRRRCPRCWHDLGPEAAGPGDPLRCSECGHRAADERATGRTRRHPLRAAAAIAGVVAIALAARARVFDRGAWSVAPTGVLMFATPRLPGGHRSPAWELAQRVQQRRLDAEEVDAALDLFLAGDPGAPAPDTAWQVKYRDLGTALLSCLGRRDERLVRFLEVPPAVAASARAGDGEGPGVLFVDADTWWPRGTEARATISIDGAPASVHAFVPWARGAPLVLELPESTEPGDGIEIAIEVRPPTRVLGEEVAWRSFAPTVIEVEGRTAGERSTLAPVDSEALREAIAASFDDGLVVWEDGEPRAGLRFNHRTTDGERFAGVAVALHIEACENGEPRRTSRIWWRAGPFSGDPAWLPSIEDREALTRLFAEEDRDGATEGGDASSTGAATGLDASPRAPARWTLRIRGDRSLASHVRGDANTPDPDAWFAGSIEVPLEVQRISGRSPGRRWGP